MRTQLLLSTVFGASLIASSAQAYTSYSPGDLSALSGDNVNQLLKTAALGTAHRALQPAGNLGMTLGFDLGVETVGIVIPDSFKTAISLATQQPAGQVPTVVPIPRLNFHKGFPLGIDLGFSYSNYQGIFNVWGLDGQWKFLGGGALPALAGRISYGHSKLYFIETHNLSVDALVSKSLVVIEPYFGLGLQTWGGELNIAGATSGLPVDVSSSQASTTGHIFVGTPLKLIILRITAELDYSFTGITTYGGKISFAF